MQRWISRLINTRRTGKRPNNQRIRPSRQALRFESLELRQVMDAQAEVIVPAADSPTSITVHTLPTVEAVEQRLLDQAIRANAGLFGEASWYRDLSIHPFNLDRPSVATTLVATTDSVLSSTNIQVAGVGEGDFVVTDGEYIYAALGQEISIFDIRDATKIERIFNTNVSGSIQALLLNGNRLTVVANEYVAPNVNAIDLFTGTRTQKSAVTIFDVSQPESPVTVKSITVDGSVSAVRAVGDDVILVVSNVISLPGPRSECDSSADPEPNGIDSNGALIDRITSRVSLPWTEPKDFFTCVYESQDSFIARERGHIVERLPRIFEDGEARLLSSPTSILWDDDGYSGNLLSIVKINTMAETPSLDAVTTIEVESGAQEYVSPENLYLMAPDTDIIPQPDGSAIYNQSTSIFKFSLAEGNSEPLIAEGTVPGFVSGQYSADESGDMLRVVTNRGWFSDASTGVYVLHQNGVALDVVGQIEGIAPQEQVFAVRFDGDLAYVDTSIANFDPLTIIDLSNPEAPKIADNIELPGNLSYLQSIDDGILLGVGGITAINGSQSQVVLFDVSDINDISMIDRDVGRINPLIGNGFGSGVRVPWGPHVVKYYADVQILAMPITEWTFDRTPFGFPDLMAPLQKNELALFRIDASAGTEAVSLVGTVESPNVILNSLKVGDNILTVTIDSVVATNVGKLASDGGSQTTPPQAFFDVFSVPRSTEPQTLDVLRNDRLSDVGADDMAKIVEVSSPLRGSVSISDDGKTLQYTPPTKGLDDSFIYVVENSAGQRAKARVSIAIRDERPDEIRRERGKEMAQKTRTALAEKLVIQVDDVYVVNIDYTEWPDSCLGIDSADECLAVATPGFRIQLGALGSTYEYHTDMHGTVLLAAEVTPPLDGAAVDDEFSIEQGSAAIPLEVLVNDFPGINFFRAPQISAVSSPSHDGTVTISESGMTLIYTPATDFVGDETFTYIVNNFSTAQVTVHVEKPDPTVDIHLQLTDTDGNPISAVSVGQTFELRIFVSDIRDIPAGQKGVYASYLDLLYSSEIASVVDRIEYGDLFQNGKSGDLHVPGLIDNLGAFVNSLTPTGGGEELLAILTFNANAAGDLEFSTTAPSNPGTFTPATDTLVFGRDGAVGQGSIHFTGGSVHVVDSFQNDREAEDVNGDGITTPIDALILINDINDHEARPLTNQLLAEGEASSLPPIWYMDPNGDGFISAVDVVRVINRLNEINDSQNRLVSPPSPAASAEGELTPIDRRNADVAYPMLVDEVVSGSFDTPTSVDVAELTANLLNNDLTPNAMANAAANTPTPVSPQITSTSARAAASATAGDVGLGESCGAVDALFAELGS